MRSRVTLRAVWCCVAVSTVGLQPRGFTAARLWGRGQQRGGVRAAVGVTSSWLCGQSKRPHQSSSTSTSHNLPLLFPSVSVPAGIISHISPERKLDERGRQDGVEVHRHLFLLYLLSERTRTGKRGYAAFVHSTKRKGRVTGPRSEGEGWQADGSVGVCR